MNCGASTKNPKTQAEMMKDCADCIDDDYVVTGLRTAVDTLCAMIETSQKTIASLLDKLPPDRAPIEQPAEHEADKLNAERDAAINALFVEMDEGLSAIPLEGRRHIYAEVLGKIRALVAQQKGNHE
jgi:hypothetical protein